jgi:hypothetical protein
LKVAQCFKKNRGGAMKNFRALFFSSLRLAGNFSHATTQQSAKILSQEFWVYKSGYNLAQN